MCRLAMMQGEGGRAGGGGEFLVSLVEREQR